MDFGQWINHSTERNYLDCSTLRGEPNPMPKAKTDLLKTKAEIVKNLKESFDYCDATFAMLDDQKILSTPQMVFSFLHTTVHNNEIYGNVVGYLRANHITPPSTEMIQEMIKAKKTPEQMMKEMMEKYNQEALSTLAMWHADQLKFCRQLGSRAADQSGPRWRASSGSCSGDRGFVIDRSARVASVRAHFTHRGSQRTVDDHGRDGQATITPRLHRFHLLFPARRQVSDISGGRPRCEAEAPQK